MYTCTISGEKDIVVKAQNIVSIYNEKIAKKRISCSFSLSESTDKIWVATKKNANKSISCFFSLSDYHEQCIRLWLSSVMDFCCPKCRRYCKHQSKKALTFTSILNRKQRNDLYFLAPSENI